MLLLSYQFTVSIEELITLVKPLVYHSLYVWNLKLINTQLFSYCLFSRTYGQQHGGNQHCGIPEKLKTCLWLRSHAKSLIPCISLLASLNNVWRGILIRLGLIKELPICITQGHSLSVHKLGRPGYLLVKLNIAAWSRHNSRIGSSSLCLWERQRMFQMRYCLLWGQRHF